MVLKTYGLFLILALSACTFAIYVPETQTVTETEITDLLNKINSTEFKEALIQAAIADNTKPNGEVSKIVNPQLHENINEDAIEDGEVPKKVIDFIRKLVEMPLNEDFIDFLSTEKVIDLIRKIGEIPLPENINEDTIEDTNEDYYEDYSEDSSEDNSEDTAENVNEDAIEDTNEDYFD